MNITEQTFLNALLLQEELLTEKNTGRAQQKARAYFAAVTGDEGVFGQQAEYFDKAYELDPERSPRFELDDNSIPLIRYVFINKIMDESEVPVVLMAQQLTWTDLMWRQLLRAWVENVLLWSLRDMTDPTEISSALADLID